MFYNLKIALRNLKFNKTYSIINIVGLAVSLTASILIMLWVQDELSYEKFYKRSDNICLAVVNALNDGQDEYWSYTAPVLSKKAKEEIPGVENACVVNPVYDLGFLEFNGKKFFENTCITVDTTFFQIFDNKFIEGSSKNAFLDQNSVVLTETLAKKMFGNESALGKPVIGGNGGGQKNEIYYVSGVVKSPPSNTRLQYDAVFSFERSKYKTKWSPWAFQNYLLLRPDANKQEIEKKLCQIHNQNDPEANVKSYRLQSLTETHLYAPDGSERGMSAVRLFSMIAFGLLTIASINYVNLVTARANKRGKEIAVRKILGSGGGKLFMQLLSEAIILFFVSFVIALILVFSLIPVFNHITNKSFSIDFLNPTLWAISCSAFLLILLLAGVYPALKLISFKPLDAFRRQSTGNTSGFSLRKILVVTQFVGAIVLIVSTIVMNKQLRYIHQKDLGFNKEQVFSTWMFANLSMRNHYENFKADLEKESSIVGVTGSEMNIIDVGNKSSFSWEGMQDGREFSIATMGVDRNLFSLLNIQLIQGAGFTGTSADSTRYYINETAVKQMGLGNPVGKSATFFKGKGTIAGVVKDFHFMRMDETIGPMVMYLPNFYWTIYVKAEKGHISEALAATQKIWKKYDPDFPCEYRFMDETFDEMYRSDQQIGDLFTYFSIIAILISCLGLFGLVTFTAETKTKEIGIRKVLGAKVGDIINMLSKEFLILVGVAMIIAFPLAYYWLNKMLQDYAYRISINWWMFVLAGGVAIILTALTVGWRAIKAATANPVKSIKAE